MNEFLSSLSYRISEIISSLEIADHAEDPDIAISLREGAQDRLQEIVIEINEKAGI